MSSKLKVFNKTGKKIIFGGCCATIAVGTFFGTKKITEAIISHPKYDLKEFPLYENQFGNGAYSEHRYANLLITKQFEERLKLKGKEEQKLVVNGMKYAVEQFNSLTSYYQYALTAQTDYFADYGIEKNTSNGYTIPLTISMNQKSNEAATTYFSTKANGEMTEASIEFVYKYFSYIWDVCEDENVLLSGENSVISSIMQHELLHTIGAKDLYKEEYLPIKESGNSSIMYYALKEKTYTNFDREWINNFTNVLQGKTAEVSKEEKLNTFNNIFSTKYALTKNVYDDELDK